MKRIILLFIAFLCTIATLPQSSVTISSAEKLYRIAGYDDAPFPWWFRTRVNLVNSLYADITGWDETSNTESSVLCGYSYVIDGETGEELYRIYKITRTGISFDIAGSGLPSGSVVDSVKMELYLSASSYPHSGVAIIHPQVYFSWPYTDWGNYTNFRGFYEGGYLFQPIALVSSIDGPGWQTFWVNDHLHQTTERRAMELWSITMIV
jgi:hypothetical protein